MKQPRSPTAATGAMLALALPPRAFSFAPALLPAAPLPRTRRAPSALRGSRPSLDTILANPDSFPNTSRILRALSVGEATDGGGDRDYEEFLAALSEEWMRYDGDGASHARASSTAGIAAAVGVATGVVAMLEEDYGAMQQGVPDQSYYYGEPQHHFASYTGSYEPHPCLNQNYHFGEGQPNVLRDLARNLPPPVEKVSDYATASYYHGDSPGYDDHWHYIAHDSTGMQVSLANTMSQMPGFAVSSATPLPIEGDALPSAVQDAATGLADSLSSQLSDITYSQSFAQVDTAAKRFSMPRMTKVPTSPDASSSNIDADAVLSRVKEFASHSTEAINHALSEAKEAGSSQMNHFFGSVPHSLDGLPQRVASAGSESFQSIGKVVGDVKMPTWDVSTLPHLNVMSNINIPTVSKFPSLDVSKMKFPSVPSFSDFTHGMGTVPAESFGIAVGSTVVPSEQFNFADTTLSDVGNAIFGSIRFLGGILFQFLDWVIRAVVGTNLSQVLNKVQTSFASFMDNASSSVVNMLDSFGDLTLKQLLQAFLTVLLVVVDMILKVTNAVVYLVSGKDSGDWAHQANTAIHTAGDQLLAQASSTYQDVTHKSFGELAGSIGDYSHHVGEELMAMMNSIGSYAGGVAEGLVDGADVSYLSAENLESIASAVQTALSM